ncbi:hypothetical protein [Pseudalkalibacillus sp. JSM 102089]|uniref:hypothetical protein n=1 Tax=Pseudalkalibacillus sp. JSM 102089 TaxID=3229856 RepID=UPI00352685E6
MKGKDLKQAKVLRIELDRERPMTFDFNAMCELQELGYHDPQWAFRELQMENLTAMKSVLYASLVAGQLTEDEDASLDLTVHKVGSILGKIMTSDKDHFTSIFSNLGEVIRDFFPSESEEQNKEETDGNDSKN